MPFHDAFDRGTIALAAFSGSVGQLTNANRSFGQGDAGFGRYFGAASDLTDQSFELLASLLETDSWLQVVHSRVLRGLQADRPPWTYGTGQFGESVVLFAPSNIQGTLGKHGSPRAP